MRRWSWKAHWTPSNRKSWHFRARVMLLPPLPYSVIRVLCPHLVWSWRGCSASVLYARSVSGAIAVAFLPYWGYGQAGRVMPRRCLTAGHAGPFSNGVSESMCVHVRAQRQRRPGTSSNKARPAWQCIKPADSLPWGRAAAPSTGSCGRDPGPRRTPCADRQL